jgi:hypothetical protein
MATITAQSAASNSALAYVAAAGGGDTISFATAQRAVIFVRNGGSSITLTMTAAQTCSQGFLHNVVTTCAAGDTEILIPPACISATGTCAVTYSSVTSVTVAAVTS